MKNSLFLLPLAALSIASPVKKRQDIDTTVLQFALTLEHLENVFYKQALQQFSESDFVKAGYSATMYRNLRYVASDEQAHTLLLEGALTAAGVTPNKACTYKFPYTDVKSFLALSTALEGVGTSAYLGGAPLITSKTYLTVAGSILVDEALHTSMQRVALGRVPSASPYWAPLNPSPVYTLAAAFIVSCPSTNAALPFTKFPSLTYASTQLGVPKRQAFFTYSGTIPAGSYATFINGLSVISKTLTHRGTGKFSAVIPTGFGGQTYVVVTSKSVTGGSVTDDVILFGPAIVDVAPAPPSIDFNESK